MPERLAPAAQPFLVLVNVSPNDLSSLNPSFSAASAPLVLRCI